MTAVLFLLGLAFPAAEPADHEKSNSVFQQLRQKGVAISDKESAPLPAPSMADGLDAKAQTAVIKKLIGDDIDYDGFTAVSVTAPFLMRPLVKIKGGNPEAPGRGLDYYFIAHGNYKSLSSKEMLDRLAGNDRKKGESKTLSAEDLKKHGITIAPEAKDKEGYGYGDFNLLDRVELKIAGHSAWSETADSVLLAAVTDPRLAPQFANQWRSLEKIGDGQFNKGPLQPYPGAAYYLKITRLKEPANGLFVESHVIFTEPTGWFDGANLLTSKLPPVIQATVRNFRQVLIKANNKGE